MSWAHKGTSQPPWGDNVGLSWGLDHCAPSLEMVTTGLPLIMICTEYTHNNNQWKLCLREPNSQLIHYLVLVIGDPLAMMLP